MTNHLHLVARSQNEPLNKLLGHFKSYTSKEIIKLIESNPKESRKSWMLPLFEKNGRKNHANKVYQVWQNGSFPIILYTEKVTNQKISYIHNNPVKAGFVDSPEHYLYSSANPYSPLKLARFE